MSDTKQSFIDDMSSTITRSMYVKDTALLKMMDEHMSRKIRVTEANTGYANKTEFIKKIFDRTKHIFFNQTAMPEDDTKSMFFERVGNTRSAFNLLKTVRSAASKDITRFAILPPVEYLETVNLETYKLIPRIGVYLYFEGIFMIPVLNVAVFKPQHLNDLLRHLYDSRVITQSSFVNIVNGLRSIGSRYSP